MVINTHFLRLVIPKENSIFVILLEITNQLI